jgi:uncharacterized protein YceK
VKGVFMKAVFLVVALSLAGCGAVEREIASFTGYSTICVGGVEYIQFTSGASVAYNPDGSVKTCGK